MRFIFLLALFSLSSSLFAGRCPSNILSKEKRISKAYQKLRFNRHCKHAKIYIDFANRAYLAGRLGEALWAVGHGMQKAKQNQLAKQKAQMLKGKIYIEMKRFEEAIIELRPVALASHGRNNPLVAQRAHLSLIKAYYLKNNKRKDSNVKYLIGLFYKYYPQSVYRPTLRNWARQNS